MSALPSFSDRGRRKIIYLKNADIDSQREILRPHRSLHAAFEIMCEGGLRRSEALWLTNDAFSEKLDEFSVMNIVDPEDDGQAFGEGNAFQGRKIRQNNFRKREKTGSWS